MSKATLATLSLVILLTAVFALPGGIRAQAAAKPFEYLRVTPFGVSMPIASNQISMHEGYHACLAAATEWSCREFRPANRSDSALRTVLMTLGSEGWELVSAVNEEHASGGLTYLFKRQAR